MRIGDYAIMDSDIAARAIFCARKNTMNLFREHVDAASLDGAGDVTIPEVGLRRGCDADHQLHARGVRQARATAHRGHPAEPRRVSKQHRGAGQRRRGTRLLRSLRST